MGKTKILTKGPTARRVYERAKYVLQNVLQGIANDFSPDMFSVQDIEVLGTPLGTDAYIKDFVAHNCIKISSIVQKFEPITDSFVFVQLVKFCMNTCTQFMSVNITLPLTVMLIRPSQMLF
jgi:hypothetical protein